MLIKEAALGDERLYLTYKNVEASSLTTGYAVALAQGTSGASFDGTQACLAGTAATGRQTGWIGISARDIAPNAYGIIQVYGPVNSVFVSNVGTSITINTGDACVPAALSGACFLGRSDVGGQRVCRYYCVQHSSGGFGDWMDERIHEAWAIN